MQEEGIIPIIAHSTQTFQDAMGLLMIATYASEIIILQKSVLLADLKGTIFCGISSLK